MAEGVNRPTDNDDYDNFSTVIRVTLQEGVNFYSTTTDIFTYSNLSEDETQRVAFLNILKAGGAEPELRPGEPIVDAVTITPSKALPLRKKSCQQSSSTSARGLFFVDHCNNNATAQKSSTQIANNIRSDESCRAQGKKGAAWQLEETDVFLRVCLSHAADLRRKTPLESTWKAIYDSLYHDFKIDKSWEQCREKMRNIKTPWNKNKSGRYAVQLNKIYCLPLKTAKLDDIGKQTEDNYVMQPILHDEANVNASENDEDLHDFNMSFHALEVDGETTETIIGTETTSVSDNDNADKCEDFGNATNFEDTGKEPERQSVTIIKCNQWPEKAVRLFVKECVNRKGYVQVSNVPNKVWKEMQVCLLAEGFSLKWEQCREKFFNMNKLFEGRLLQCNGVMSGVVWPYYEDFLNIHDVPEDFSYQVLHVQNDDIEEDSLDLLFSEDGARKKETTASTKIWPEGGQKVNDLVNEYAKRKQLFESTKSPIRHNTLWRDIAAEMIKMNYQVTLPQCKRKMNDLLMEFKRYYDASKRTGAGACTWSLYGKFLQMYKGNPVLKPPYSAAAGSSFRYSSAKSVKKQSVLVSAEESSPDSPEKKPKQKKAPIY
ncbi:hypothetical protein ONE63_003506 [Megalurothrips usitatus]|uniref:Myb/SANT-like DNA-binding domain-containing protein n=1 Tax=Megalurothrips usitatus TaxID=439358 RepID=A0AAV7X9Q3_9NEOP|nr:hypothetical protein ONE63_003506 [Megalurothrips usitatus]